MSKLIEMGKKYTSNGKPVTIRYVDGKNARYPVLAEFEDGGVELFSSSGAYSDLIPSEYDLVEASPYADWKIDQKIMVSDDGKTLVQEVFCWRLQRRFHLCMGRWLHVMVGGRSRP